jgi:hypothetical protein
MADTNGHTLTPDPGAGSGPELAPDLIRGQALLRQFAAHAARTLREAFAPWQWQGRRNLPAILGYKPELTYDDYKQCYERRDLAHRLIRAYPEATWSQPPTVQEDDQDDVETPFEVAWQALVMRLGVYARLVRTDVLANLGQYSVLLIGLRGQPDLAAPARPVRSPDDVLFLAPYSEEFAEIEAFETNPASPLFGQPSVYKVTFNRQTTSSSRTLPRKIGFVHASRVLHVSEDCLDDDVYGIPRLKPVFDRLEDLLKVVGGSAEFFFRGAQRLIGLEGLPDYQLQPGDEEAFKTSIEEFQHRLKDYIRVEGATIKELSGQAASPRDHFDVLMDLIAGTTGIPKRILTGSERGELASTQDQEAWLQRVSRRQTTFAEQSLLRPLIDRLLLLGALPAPVQPYSVVWENLFALSSEKQALIAKDVATALAQYAGQGMAATVVPEPEFRQTYLGLSAESDFALPDVPPDDEDL